MHGFTLLEVLLATLLLASAIAVTAASVRGMARAGARSETKLAENGERNAVLGLLRARIAAAMAVKFDLGDGGETVFVGGPARMEFVTDLPPYTTLAGPMRQVIEAQPVAAGQLLCVANGPRQISGLRCQPGAQTTLVDGLAQAGFRYRGRDEDGRPGPWLDEWKRPEILPEWVEVKLTARPGQHEWPLLRVRLPLATGPAP
ncbi:prepilin-type N-terminal cleavage/methylation domain-containing protein [Solilutibacter pythonis]|uniref:prepilin-type N-terminal cleavage/methylation domain-containing protein n=1 Tax=Solilutibacter pythonis TaxID=2483112 RepID=UPI001314F380|nr:prepilin-type N-terminal cleavage/methylation domain-containing protein [Lysobacter pythonis]